MFLRRILLNVILATVFYDRLANLLLNLLLRHILGIIRRGTMFKLVKAIVYPRVI